MYRMAMCSVLIIRCLYITKLYPLQKPLNAGKHKRCYHRVHTYIIVPLEKENSTLTIRIEQRSHTAAAAETINYNTVISILKARGYYLRTFFTIILCIDPLYLILFNIPKLPLGFF